MGMKIVQIVFAGNYEVLYDFFTDMSGLKPGAIVVCDTSRGYSCGTVVGFIESSTKAERWIVCVVPVETHQMRMAAVRRQAEELAEMLI